MKLFELLGPLPQVCWHSYSTARGCTLQGTRVSHLEWCSKMHRHCQCSSPWGAWTWENLADFWLCFVQQSLWIFRDFQISFKPCRVGFYFRCGSSMIYFLTCNKWNTLTDQVSNGFCHLPPGIIAIAEINEALNSGDHQQTLAALLLPTAKLMGVNPATAKHYHDVLQYTKKLLCQVFWL